MAEREVWKIVGERFGLYKKMRGVDGFGLTEGLTEEALKELNEEEIRGVLAKHGLVADMFFGNDDFWKNIQEKINSNE